MFARLLTLCVFTGPVYLWNELIGRGHQPMSAELSVQLWTDGQGCTMLSPPHILGTFWVSSNQYLLFLFRWLQSCSSVGWGGGCHEVRPAMHSCQSHRACYRWTPVAHPHVSYPAPCWGGGASLGQPSWLLEKQEEALLFCLCLFRERAASLSLSTEPTISIANQELSEILKLNLKPQDMYKRVRIMPAFFYQSQLLHYVCLG